MLKQLQAARRPSDADHIYRGVSAMRYNALPASAFLLFTTTFLPACDWLGKGTAVLKQNVGSALAPAIDTSAGSSVEVLRAGTLAVGNQMADELTVSLVSSGQLTQDQAVVISDGSKEEVNNTAGTLVISTLALADTTPIEYASGPVVKGAIKMLNDERVGLPEAASRSAIVKVIMSSTFTSLQGKVDDLDLSKLKALQRGMVGTAVLTLNVGGLGGDAAPDAIKAVTGGAVEALGSTVASGDATDAAAQVVSGAIESLGGDGLSAALIKDMVSSATEGGVSGLTKAGVADPGSAAADIATATVQSLGSLITNTPSMKDHVSEASEGAARGAVAGLAKNDVVDVAKIVDAAKKIAAASVASLSSLSSSGIDSDSICKAAGSIGSGSIQGVVSAVSLAGQDVGKLTAKDKDNNGLMKSLVETTLGALKSTGVGADAMSKNFDNVGQNIIAGLTSLKSVSSTSDENLISNMTTDIMTGYGSGMSSAGMNAKSVSTKVQDMMKNPATLTVLQDAGLSKAQQTAATTGLAAGAVKAAVTADPTANAATIAAAVTASIKTAATTAGVTVDTTKLNQAVSDATTTTTTTTTTTSGSGAVACSTIGATFGISAAAAMTNAMDPRNLYCDTTTKTSCPLPDPAASQIIHGPDTMAMGTGFRCHYFSDAPNCSTIFGTATSLTHVQIESSKALSDMGDARCAVALRATCPASPDTGYYDLSANDLTDLGIRQCTYTRKYDPCGSVETSPIDATALAAMPSVPGMPGSHICAASSPNVKAALAPDLLNAGFEDPNTNTNSGTNRLVVRSNSMRCPTSPNMSNFTAQMLSGLPDYPNLLAKACDVPSGTACPAIATDVTSITVSSKTFAANVLDTVSTTRCYYASALPVCSGELVSGTTLDGLTVMAGANPPHRAYGCSTSLPTCPSLDTAFDDPAVGFWSTMTTLASGNNRCVYQTRIPFCSDAAKTGAIDTPWQLSTSQQGVLACDQPTTTTSCPGLSATMGSYQMSAPTAMAALPYNRCYATQIVATCPTGPIMVSDFGDPAHLTPENNPDSPSNAAACHAATSCPTLDTMLMNSYGYTSSMLPTGGYLCEFGRTAACKSAAWSALFRSSRSFRPPWAPLA